MFVSLACKTTTRKGTTVNLSHDLEKSTSCAFQGLLGATPRHTPSPPPSPPPILPPHRSSRAAAKRNEMLKGERPRAAPRRKIPVHLLREKYSPPLRGPVTFFVYGTARGCAPFASPKLLF